MTDFFIRAMHAHYLLSLAQQKRMAAIFCYCPKLAWKLKTSAERTTRRAEMIRDGTLTTDVRGGEGD